jgi:hypothetical protein
MTFGSEAKTKLIQKILTGIILLIIVVIMSLVLGFISWKFGLLSSLLGDNFWRHVGLWGGIYILSIVPHLLEFLGMKRAKCHLCNLRKNLSAAD